MKDFSKDIPVEALFEEGPNTNRRDFLKWCGVTLSAAVLAACEKSPVKYALPYVKKPAEHIPSIADYYATTYFDGQIFQSVLAKVRDGRPIKIEGNPSFPLSEGGTHVRGQASVLSLYDHMRLQKPQADGQESDWSALGAALVEQLKAQDAQGKLIYLITAPIISPSLQNLISEWLGTFKNARHIVYAPESYDALLTAHEVIFGVRTAPTYRFDKAQVIVGLNADFLGTWLDPTTFSRQWSKNRQLYGEATNLSYHVQFESVPTITGLSADRRIALSPVEIQRAIVNLYNRIAELAGQPPANNDRWDTPNGDIAHTAKRLWESRGKAIVVARSHIPVFQALVAGINILLDSYGNTIFVQPGCRLRSEKDADFETFLTEAKAGRVGGVILHQVNPAYDYPQASTFIDVLKSVPVSVSITQYKNETAQLCKYVLAEDHYLESWGDAQPYDGLYTLQQPTIAKIFSTKSFAEILLGWLGRTESHLDYLKAFWAKNIYPAYKDVLKAREGGKAQPFWAQTEAPLPVETAEAFWLSVLERGVLDMTNTPAAQPKLNWNLAQWVAQLPALQDPPPLTVYVYEKVGIGDGRVADNPWLQEFPDPVSRVSWDNYAVISPVYARQAGLNTNDVITLSVGNVSVELPVYVLPGADPKTIAVAMGYGRDVGGRAAVGIGKNVFSFFSKLPSGHRTCVALDASVAKLNANYELARIQQWETYVGREYIREASLAAYKEDKKAGNHEAHELISLWWKEHPQPGHKWGMAIDLNLCTGCGACVVACIAENNIPVVGRDEMRRGRDMHWIRIDRYFTSQRGHTGKPEEFPAAPPEDFPRAFFQPMLCQHCDHAPCETVCPVLAIAHSSEGINQQVYNRCVGTRYCANNCPYKVRRFNWFDYTNAERWVFNPVDELGRMVLNPDVTVRARGVMEKCSFCTQRIQAGKLEAKKQGRPLRDGDIKTACQQACPTGAIVFGDLNDPESLVSKRSAEPRGYYALSELNIRPSVRYMVKIRNEEIPQTHHA
ncbi:MAG: 4Fe-4S dicluster domain-containing protein [Bacteroidia bacterium]|nr:4Fe-4S dicluster domain-containing protein [Bacteroidia bacterium]MCX7652852.1 4Fe-4S dicluster domain-containing protein [Bacteroidia bacterium]MDW8417600.1 4Fe-4S dicluster domain-containing protein [Bacteroidia bacterium]